MVCGTKIEDCCETVIAALAAHIERMEVNAELSANSKQRLTEENMALRHELDAAKARIGMYEEQLIRIKAFCSQQLAAQTHDADLSAAITKVVDSAKDLFNCPNDM